MVKEYENKKEEYEEQLTIHLEELAQSGQTELGRGGELGDSLADALRLQIEDTDDAAEDARMWTLTVYDTSKWTHCRPTLERHANDFALLTDTFEEKAHLKAQLASNLVRPSKPTDL